MFVVFLGCVWKTTHLSVVVFRTSQLFLYHITSTALLRQQTRQTMFFLFPIHTYLDIFESTTFSFRIQKFPRPHVEYSNQIRLSTGIPWNINPDSL